MAFTQEQLEALARPLRHVIFDAKTIKYLEWVRDNPNDWAYFMQMVDHYGYDETLRLLETPV